MTSNPEQYQAIHSNARTILCLAGAGCGKTFSMIERITRLIEDGQDPAAILVLTFTNAAAFEMDQRFKKRNPGVRISPEFRTFHSFCYSLIIKDKAIREHMGYKKVPEICEERKIKEIQRKAKLQCGCKLSDAKLENPETLTKAEHKQYEIYMKAYDRIIKEENQITFDMLCYEICELFEKGNPLVDKYKKKYNHVICDEAQDTDPRQFKFIASFPATCNIYLCGDVLQGIYAFRGCTNEFVKVLSEDPNWEKIRINQNYRSSRQICDFANRFSKKYASPSYRVEMTGQFDGEPVEVLYGSETSQQRPVDPGNLHLVVERMKNNSEEIAILCRTNNEVKYICSRFDEEGIPYVTSVKTTEAGDILNSAASNQYMMDWLAGFLDTKEYSDYIRNKELAENADIRWFLTTYGKRSQIHDRAKTVIAIREILNHVTDTSEEKFNKIFKKLKLKTLFTIDTSKEYTSSELLTAILDSYQQAEESKIYVGTIHSVKGLEYEHVYVMGVDGGMFRLGTEEMNNLYYVAITRAIKRLTVFLCE